MGIFGRFGKGVSGGAKVVEENGGTLFGKAWRATKGALGGAIGGTAEGIGYAVGRSGGAKPLKYGAVGAAVVGAMGGLYYLSRRGKKEFKASDQFNEPLPPLNPAPQVLTADMLAAGPADGRMAGEWQNRVATMRGGQQMAAGMPSQGVVPEESVQNLGAVPTR